MLIIHRVAFGKIMFWKHFLYLSPSSSLSFVYIDFYHKFIWRRWRGIKNILYVVVRQWDGVENKTTVAIYAGGALTALWLSSTLVGAINTLPLVCFAPPSSTPLTSEIPCCSTNSHLFSYIQKHINLRYCVQFWCHNRSFISFHSVMFMDFCLLLRSLILA